MNLDARTGLKQGALKAVVIRADGSHEDLGVVSYSHSSPLRQLWWNLIGARRATRRTDQANEKILKEAESHGDSCC